MAAAESLVYEKKCEEKDEEAKPNPPKKPKLDPPLGEGGAAEPPEGGIEAALCGEAAAVIADRRAADGYQEVAEGEEEARTGVGDVAGPSELLAIIEQ
jgi:hypothetical protein